MAYLALALRANFFARTPKVYIIKELHMSIESYSAAQHPISAAEYDRDKALVLPPEQIERGKAYILRYKENYDGYQGIHDTLVAPLVTAQVGRVWGFKIFAPYLDQGSRLRVFTNPDGVAFNPYSLPLSESGQLDPEDECGYFMPYPELTDFDINQLTDLTTPHLGQIALGNF